MGERARGITEMLSFLASFLNSHPAIGWEDADSVSTTAQGGDPLMEKNPFGIVLVLDLNTSHRPNIPLRALLGCSPSSCRKLLEAESKAL